MPIQDISEAYNKAMVEEDHIISEHNKRLRATSEERIRIEAERIRAEKGKK